MSVVFNGELVEIIISGEFQVNTHTSDSQRNSSTTALADGGFVVTWQSDGQDGSNYGIYAQRYDASGNTQGAEFQVNTYTSSHQSNPSTTALADGGFVITWADYGQTIYYWDCFAQRYDADGNKVGNDFQVNTFYGYEQDNPKISALNDGSFVIIWQSNFQDNNTDNDYGVYAQRYDGSGNTLGSEFQVNTYASSNHKTAIS